MQRTEVLELTVRESSSHVRLRKLDCHILRGIKTHLKEKPIWLIAREALALYCYVYEIKALELIDPTVEVTWTQDDLKPYQAYLPTQAKAS